MSLGQRLTGPAGDLRFLVPTADDRPNARRELLHVTRFRGERSLRRGQSASAKE
jgi:hypothetical protein